MVLRCSSSPALWPLMGRGKAGCPGRIPAAEGGAHRQVLAAGGATAEAGERIQGLRVQPGEEVCAGQGQVGRLGTCWGPHISLQLFHSLEGHHILPRLSPKILTGIYGGGGKSFQPVPSTSTEQSFGHLLLSLP